MENFLNYFKKEKWTKVLLLFGVVLFIFYGEIYLISVVGEAPLTSVKGRGGYFHYVWISVQKEKIEGEVVDLEGHVQDEFLIE